MVSEGFKKWILATNGHVLLFESDVQQKIFICQFSGVPREAMDRFVKTREVKSFSGVINNIVLWLGSLSVGLGLFLSPLIVAFCRRKSTRLTAVFGGLTAALGCLFTSFASQMHQVFLSYGFVMALGLSLARVTSSLMIGQYFKRRRERVEVIVASGTGCGVIIFSYSFAKIIRVLGWRLGLHAITGLAVIPFFVGICYRSASLYHPQRRAILHLKNQRKKIKDKSGISDKPPFFDWTPLRNGSILVSMLSAAICAFGLYCPFFYLNVIPDQYYGPDN
ncbi:uncharacterized protein CDAR_9051 [Caerostris darwini]|uniref:Uncharacterized protein n=1 Tax=Caerostris darwini TaxID=1538125 RepID=A0AAV4SIC5_9ARAC|nr:uncharacterized protein CDAR_9051 [Caerostris darwini]